MNRPSTSRTLRFGFTLLEIMIVVGLLAVIVAMGVPTLVSALRKEGMRKAVSDLVEACNTARSTAILTGHAVDLVIHPLDKSFSISAASSAPDPGYGTAGAAVESSPEDVKSFSATLPSTIHIELLGVNHSEMQDAAEARIRFYPNSTSDEFTIILRSDSNECRIISLELVTALPEVEVVR